MSLTNAAETALLTLLFNNTDWANIGDAAGLQNSATAGSLFHRFQHHGAHRHLQQASGRPNHQTQQLGTTKPRPAERGHHNRQHRGIWS